MTTKIYKSLIGLVKALIDSPMSKEFIFYASSTAFVQVARFGISLFAAKTVGLSVWGVWQLLYLLLAYSSFFHLGIINGMNREIPLLSGRGYSDKIDEVKGVTLGTVLLVCLAISILIFALSFLLTGFVSASVMRALALLFTTYVVYNFIEVYLRSSALFIELSKQRYIFSIAFLLLVPPAVSVFRLEGYICSQSLVILLTVAFILKKHPLKIKPRLDLTEARRLVKIGFPIMIGFVIFTFMTTADRWIIATFLNFKQLGYYSLSIITIQGVMMIPIIVAQQFFPRMANTWGQTSDSEDLIKWVRTHSVINLGLLIPMTLLVYHLMPVFVEFYMPEFGPGITAMKISLAVPVFFGLATVFVNMLTIVDRQFQLMLIRAIVLVINIGLNIVFVKNGYGINGVALGTAVSFAFYYLAVFFLGKSVLRKMSQTQSAILLKSVQN
jgi:O-antigen/teichoic acid export membrane protein